MFWDITQISETTCLYDSLKELLENHIFTKKTQGGVPHFGLV